MGIHKDLRTRDEIICDMVADDRPFEEIAYKLREGEASVRARWQVIKQSMGWLGE